MRRIVGMVAALSVSIAAMAQEYPSRPVKIVLPYPLGGPGDFISRTVGEKLQQKLGQPFLIEPRPGANLRMGTEFLAKSAPDGHTILFGGITPFVFNPLMYSKLQYDPKDLTGVIMVARSQLVLVSKPALPAKTVPELVAAMKENPRKLNFGSAGTPP